MAGASFPALRSLYKDFWDSDFLRRFTRDDYGQNLFEDDPISSMLSRSYLSRPRPPVVSHTPQLSSNENSFEVTLNVSRYEPEEITVKTTPDNYIIIEGKQEEKEIEDGVICSKKFTRRYLIPHGIDPETISSTFVKGGFLTVYSPRQLKATDRVVPVTVKEREDYSNDFKFAAEAYQKERQANGRDKSGIFQHFKKRMEGVTELPENSEQVTGSDVAQNESTKEQQEVAGSDVAQNEPIKEQGAGDPHKTECPPKGEDVKAPKTELPEV